MRWVYLSPHLDDAVLSAGGLIYEKIRSGQDVEIWTLMCGFPSDAELSPFAQILHAQWGISSATEVVRARREEDSNAARILGAKTLYFDFLDCIYRRGQNGDWLYADVFVQPHEDESHLAAQIAEVLAAHLRPDDQLICQFGIGSHVDHILVRRAAELLKRPILYTADIPYLFNSPEELPPHIIGMKEIMNPISDAALNAWQNAIEKYESQISGLFESADDMREKIARYTAENHGVKLWGSY